VGVGTGVGVGAAAGTEGVGVTDGSAAGWPGIVVGSAGGVATGVDVRTPLTSGAAVVGPGAGAGMA
jgi:hypothetical protein